MKEANHSEQSNLKPVSTQNKSTQEEKKVSSTGRLLSLKDIREEYPCDNCKAPCCTYLPLHTFNITNIRELDHALYLLNFQRIELGLSATGEWGVYYRYPCRFLERENGLCSIYGEEMRPSICAHYSPYSCWYKKVIGPNIHESFLRIDKNRMDTLVEHLGFDEDHNLVSIPDWATMCAILEKVPLSETYDEEFDQDDTVFNRWLYEAAYGTSNQTVMEETHTYKSLMNPCDACKAYCCKYLVFPQAIPTTRVNLDYLQFILGFPGLEIGVSDNDWSVIVKTQCQHLKENKCSIYGRKERPQICTFYDAHGCQYVSQFGLSRPDNFMRVRLEQFYWLVEPLRFDPQGNITYMPSTEEFKRHIEAQWHQQVISESEKA